MDFTFKFILHFLATMMLSVVLTPLVKLLAFQIGAVDQPGARRINKKVMPTIGGLAIFIAFTFGCFLQFHNYAFMHRVWGILFGAVIVVVTGLIDDVKELSPGQKSIGLLLAALEIYFIAGLRMDTISIPFIGMFHLGWFSLPMTVIWIFAITNAVNLIDGLDGLAAGVSMIALSTIGIVSFFFLPDAIGPFMAMFIFLLVAAILGFFPYNFHPATIFLGDTGALFLGFMISVVSLQGLKNVTFISVLTPMFILGVPITDTVFAIIRRKFNKQPISSADKMHLHHRLLSLGFSHRGAVLTIYGLALTFAFIALLMNYASKPAIVLMVVFTTIGLELFIELIGLVGENRQPLLKTLKFFGNSEYRHEYLLRRYEKKKAEKEQEKQDKN
ncbi:glycosyltransferase family 4 protein [Enterococcus columbae]|uniref:Glycosyl transferase, group 4 family protein n=1 Tax=Enterococcus columbae DSM 7374 = ATCC 51263 TaxID=1121865 RepID=S0KM96_9ENTE|nr:MraY family glycosyltransferase [Enterococcus columbae]EOT40316.1 glycosyl transferase, group 4 family protein [Enterococcus columbae DSM 7374 = ATCC 51263]EOW84054.1 glycosyl transferase, group 4 family protein [Enterococcus columbae DSM 7374 = ATCC 51263]OJG25422.1 glycosyl transferase, group 4 family protein [Enterococcus columbae DSM 7374 = ATCC 51263]